MAEVSALTPSPPGLGDPHTSPSSPPHPSDPHPHHLQPPVPKSAIYGDPSLSVSAARGARDPPMTLQQHGQGPPPTPPKPILLAPPVGSSEALPAECSKPPKEGGAEAGTGAVPPQGAEHAVPEQCSHHNLNPSPDLGCTISVDQAPNPHSDGQLPSPPAVLPLRPPAEAQPPLLQAEGKDGNPLQRPPLPPHAQPPRGPEPPDTPKRAEAPTSPRTDPFPPIPIVQEPPPSLYLPNPHPRPAPDTLSYLESASLMSGTLESLSGLGEDGSSLGSDSEVNGGMFRRTDKYGFLGGAQYSDSSEREIAVDVARQREMKWLEMFGSWDKWVSRRFQKVKLRCRKGIPSSLRAKAWQLLSNSQELLESNHNKFEELEREQGDPKWLDIIEKDLHRQFPFHEMFAARGGHGQQDLYRILKAYTVYRPDEGYCQAQAPVAAVLLMHMPAEQAFWCLVQICEKYLPGYYSAGLEAIQLDGEIFFSLLRRVCPMAYRHLKKFKIDPILYMTEWFMCIFSRTLPWACVLRVWDMFFCEGVKIVFRVGLVLLKQMLGSVDKLRELQGMYETMERLRNIPQDFVREDALVLEVMSVPVTEALIERESSIQVRKWRESRGELTHQPRRRLHGTRAIHELKVRSASISSGGSFSFLGGSAPAPGPLRGSSSLLSLPGMRRSKTPFRLPGKKGSLQGGLELKPPPGPGAQSHPQPVPPVHPSPKPPPTAMQGEAGTSAQVLTPPCTLGPSPKIVSEQITPTIPSPAANNTRLPPALDGARGAAEEEVKKKKRSKEEKKKDKEEEKQKAKERKEKERVEKERLKKEKERAEKEKRKEKGGKKKEKGDAGGEMEEKNGAPAPRESA